ncbi:MAG: hypothetical protein GF310_01870 [candidate division Zixibacteria bacterium]|nr:hypothetical protein [candidate division Zixibacteria bacterium]
MGEDKSYSNLEKLYKQLYVLTEQLEEYALRGQAGQDDLKKLHYKVYNLKDETLRNWLDIKKKLDSVG